MNPSKGSYHPMGESVLKRLKITNKVYYGTGNNKEDNQQVV